MRGKVAKIMRRRVDEEAMLGIISPQEAKAVYRRRKKNRNQKMLLSPSMIRIYPPKRHKSESISNFRKRRAKANRRKRSVS